MKKKFKFRNSDKEDFFTIGIALVLVLYLGKSIAPELDLLTEFNTLALAGILLTIKLHYSKKVENDRLDKYKRLDLFVEMKNIILLLINSNKIEMENMLKYQKIKLQIKYYFDDEKINDSLDNLEEKFNFPQSTQDRNTQSHNEIVKEYEKMDILFERYMPDRLS
jgi:hypothetical protein